MSRNRKKAYIDELETKVASLNAVMQQLQNENRTLKQENAMLRSQSGGGGDLVALAAPATEIVLATPAAPNTGEHRHKS